MRSVKEKLGKSAKNVFNIHKDEIEDIILFGSFMKGKEKPKDIDLLIIFKNKVNKQIESELKKDIALPEADINSTTQRELEGEGFIAKEGLYLEGFSLINSRALSQQMGFTSVAFIKYDLQNTKGSKRIRFYYALQGRNKATGFLKEVRAKRFSESVIICDYNIIERIKPFFEQWDIKYNIIPALIPKRLRPILLSD